jgi:hypothetical protein
MPSQQTLKPSLDYQPLQKILSTVMRALMMYMYQKIVILLVVLRLRSEVIEMAQSWLAQWLALQLGIGNVDLKHVVVSWVRVRGEVVSWVRVRGEVVRSLCEVVR